jgi:predicted MFS family arabinose efflux permease
VEAASTPAGRARAFQALRHRDFRLLWAGQTVSMLGDGAFLVALGWRTFTLTGSARSLGYVLMLQWLGLVLTVLVGGALADRYQRRTLMLASDVSRFGIVAALAALDVSGHMTFPRLAAIAFAEGLATGFFQPAFGGIVPLVVEQRSLASANALIGMSRQTSFLAGPGLAGLLYGFAGSGTVFAFDAASFLVSAALLWPTAPRAVEAAPPEGTLREIRAGARYVAGVPWLWVSLVIFSLVLMLQYSAIQVLMPKFVKTEFGLGVGSYGLIVSLLGGGMVLGTLAFGQTNPRRRRGVLAYAVWMTNSVLVVAMGLSPWFALAAGLALARGTFIGYGNGIWETMLMELVPAHMLSRVISFDWFGAFGLTPVGLVLAGAVSGLAAPGKLIALAAGISACLTAAGFLVRGVREIQ